MQDRSQGGIIFSFLIKVCEISKVEQPLWYFLSMFYTLFDKLQKFSKIIKSFNHKLETSQHSNHYFPKWHVANSGDIYRKLSWQEFDIDFSLKTFGFCDHPINYLVKQPYFLSLIIDTEKMTLAPSEKRN